MADYLEYERAFRNAGITYTAEPDYKERGHGDLNGVKFIVVHHTAGGGDSGDIRIVRDGRSDLPGPLSQIVLKRDGNPHIVAVGICYHAPGKINFRGVPAGSGNYWSIGIEGVSNGYNDWTDAQRVGYPKVVAALLKDLGLPSDAWIFHRDYQPGEKIDAAGFERDWFQRQVDAAYNGIAVESAIVALRKKNDWLGNRIEKGDSESVTPDGVGRYVHYESGSIYWHPAIGAHTIRKDVFEKWSTFGWEAGEMGYPIWDAGNLANDGHFSKFQNGSLYFNPSAKKVYQVKGAVFDRWGELQWENGPLGYPTSDEVSFGVGVVQTFERGLMFWSPLTGAFDVTFTGIQEEFNRVGKEVLGFPKAAAKATADGRANVQRFEKGTIYEMTLKSSSGVVKAEGHALIGPILDIYDALGAESGRLGLPISDVYLKDIGTQRVDFEAGSIERNVKTNDLYLVLSGKRVDIPLVQPQPKPEAPDLTGKLLADYSVGLPGAKALKDAGFVGAVRYTSDPRETWMKGKPLTKSEVDDFKKNGLVVVSNYQYAKGGNTTSDWTVPSDGPADAARGLELHKAAGGPNTAPIYVSIDASPTRDMYEKQVRPYLLHWQKALTNARLGVYANGRVIEWLLTDGIGTYFWCHNWSSLNGKNYVNPQGVDNGPHPAAHLHQIRIDKDAVAGIGIDVNVILKKEFGQW